MLAFQVRVEALRHLVQELWGAGEIPERVIEMRMSKVGRQRGQALLHIDTGSIPVQEGSDGKTVSQVMKARTIAIGRAAETDLVRELDEGPL